LKLKDVEKAIKTADFDTLIPNEEHKAFYEYLNQVIETKTDKVIIRFAHEEDRPYGLPFFSWVVYKITSIGDHEGYQMLNWDRADFIYPTDPKSYTEVPKEAVDNPFYAVKRIIRIKGAEKVRLKDKIRELKNRYVR